MNGKVQDSRIVGKVASGDQSDPVTSRLTELEVSLQDPPIPAQGHP